MKRKFIIKQRYVCFQYVVVEADSKAEAMTHIPMIHDEVVTDRGYFTNIQVKEYKTGDFVFCKKFHFIVVTKKNLCHSIRKLAQKLGLPVKFEPINEVNLKPVNPGNPVYSRPK